MKEIKWENVNEKKKLCVSKKYESEKEKGTNEWKKKELIKK